MADLLEDADAKLARNEIELLGCYDVHREIYENDPEAPEARRAFLENLLAPFLARIRDLETALAEVKAQCDRWWGMLDDRGGLIREYKARAEAAEAERDRIAAEWADVSQRNYQRAKAAEAEAARLRVALMKIEEGFPAGTVQLGNREPLWRDVYRDAQMIARVALKGGDG